MPLIQRQPTPIPPPLDVQSGDYPPESSSSLSARRTPTPAPSLSTARTKTPLPYLKILPLLIQRWSEGLTYAIIFPYINEMVHSMGVEEKSVGVWSATAESAMMVTESIAAPLYAPIADRFGRRPVLIALEMMWGVFGIAFGFSKTVWMVIVIRSCLGLLAGCGVISRTMIGEMCDRSNRIQGFALFSPAVIVGMTTAPVLGGFLANPVPRLLPRSWTTFVEYPYLLPALMTGLATIIGGIVCILLLPETLQKSKYNQQGRSDAEKSQHSGLGGLLRYKKFQNVLTLYGLHNAIMFSWEAVYPLYGYTSKELGGLGLSTPTLGVILGLSAGLSIFMTIFIFPILHGFFSEHRCLLLCLTAYPVATVFFPIIWAMSYSSQGDNLPKAVWVIMAIQMIIRRVGDFAATQLDTLVLDAIPGPEHLASANSVTFSIAAVGRATGPFITSWFFSLSTRFSSAFSPGRQLVWFVFVLLSAPSIILAYRLGDEVNSSKEEHVHEEERYELISEPLERTSVELHNPARFRAAS
ncbi:hypothetical protein CI109_106997 [Kwoniella shandongensis]|uniref:Uncharacterized protein n=1 Tax=Kwoniella shandongensis TaxID=1734106 RepID=A0A5M6C6C1_9TREE|nr:uncharacterized protein CI109_000751 [Kwoniella shandongensis]KAA5530573.1 hypothetical protein CI109_000751 [Kwoniella shandongensis]